MASVFGHAALAFGILKVHPSKIFNAKVLILGIVSSIIPDIDVLCFNYGIDDLHILGHRGLTHSISFALLWAAILIVIFHKNEASRKVIFLFYSLSMISHGLLDAMTTGGAGIAFFYPLTEFRYFLPFRFIQVSPVSAADFFSTWGLQVLLSEIMSIGVMTLILIGLGQLVNKRVYK